MVTTTVVGTMHAAQHLVVQYVESAVSDLALNEDSSLQLQEPHGYSSTYSVWYSKVLKVATLGNTVLVSYFIKGRSLF